MSDHNWTRKELLLVFNLYCRTPFGKLHRSNPEIVLLAGKLGRTPSAVAMKLVNFASFDPVQKARKVRGLSNASKADRMIWDEFNTNAEQLAFESQQALQSLADVTNKSIAVKESDVFLPEGPTEATLLMRTRLVQGFFRNAVLSSYEFKCTICQIGLQELLSASHIIPWSKNVERRADPRNGLSLCALHDRAFDRGLLTVDESYKVLLSTQARLNSSGSRMHIVALLDTEGQSITLPKRFFPDPDALAYHREYVFKR